MKFIVSVPGLFLYPRVTEPWHVRMTPADMVRYAQRVDELGYDYISIPEHVIMPRELEGSMGTRWPEPVVTMAFLAGATSRIRFVTGVLVLPYRNPVVLAKGIATLDYLSGGRVTLGVGVGHLEREFAILNVPFSERGARGDEYIRAIKELWTADNPSFNGRFVQFDDIVFDPKPGQRPYPPIWVGGHSKASMRRAANLADGWQPFSTISLAELPPCLDYIRDQPGYQNRSRPFDIVMPSAAAGDTPTGGTDGRDALIQRFSMLKEVGVTHTGPSTGRAGSMEESLERLQWFAEEIMPACR